MADVKEETTTLKCGPCFFDGETVEPKHFCVDCLEYLCTECIRDHRKNKSSRGHKVLEESELPQDVKLFEEIKKLSHCPIHPDVELYQYCPNHDVLICMHCLTNDHMLCKNLTEFTCLLKKKYTVVNPGELFVELPKISKAKHTELMTLLETFQINNSEVENDIHSFVQKLKDNLENLEDTLNEKRKHLVSPLTQYVRQCEQTLSNIEKKALFYAKLFAFSTKYGTVKQNAVIHFMASMLLKEFEADDILKRTATKKIKFIHPVTTTNLVSQLHQCDVVLSCKDEQASELCSDETSLDNDPSKRPEMKTRDIATKVETTWTSCEHSSRKSLQKMQIVNNKLGLIKFISNQNEEIRRDIVALETLSDGRIILLDREKLLKCYSQNLKLESTFQLQHGAKDMCVIEENTEGIFTVAVCFDPLCKITFLEHNGEFREKYDITCSGNVINLAMYTKHLVVLVVSKNLQSPYEIQFLDISTGHVCYVVDEFRRASDTSKLTIYGPIRMCVCKITQQVIICDHNTLYMFDKEDGECVMETVYAIGLCQSQLSKDYGKNKKVNIKDAKCDSQGNIYFVDKRGVHQLDRSHKERIVISMNANLSSIAIDEGRTRIVVGYMDSDRAYVYEYRLPDDD